MPRYQVRYSSEHADRARGALFDTYTDPAKANRAAACLTKTFRQAGLRFEAKSVRVLTLGQ